MYCRNALIECFSRMGPYLAKRLEELQAMKENTKDQAEYFKIVSGLIQLASSAFKEGDMDE